LTTKLVSVIVAALTNRVVPLAVDRPSAIWESLAKPLYSIDRITCTRMLGSIADAAITAQIRQSFAVPNYSPAEGVLALEM
jgi:hypothetical protein